MLCNCCFGHKYDFVLLSVYICRETGLLHVAVMKMDTLSEVLRYNSIFCCYWLRFCLSLYLYKAHLLLATWFSLAKFQALLILLHFNWLFFTARCSAGSGIPIVCRLPVSESFVAANKHAALGVVLVNVTARLLLWLLLKRGNGIIEIIFSNVR